MPPRVSASGPKLKPKIREMASLSKVWKMPIFRGLSKRILGKMADFSGNLPDTMKPGNEEEKL